MEPNEESLKNILRELVGYDEEDDDDDFEEDWECFKELFLNEQ